MTRGPRHSASNTLDIAEIDADERIVAQVMFDPDDIDAAFEELDARYLAGEAAAHAHTWSVITAGPRRASTGTRCPATTHDWVTSTTGEGDVRARRLTAYFRATWDLTPDVNFYIEAVHRLSDLGAVITHATNGTSKDGFDAEWRELIDF